MDGETLAAALEREHREIDEGIETFTRGIAGAPGRSGEESVIGSLTRAMVALRRHIYLEEEFLFPPLRESGMLAPVLVMLREHGELWTTMEALEEELGKGAASGSVVKVCRDLAGQLEAHNSKEEPIIYPQADKVLPEPASTKLRAFLATGRTPEGWVCHGARA